MAFLVSVQEFWERYASGGHIYIFPLAEFIYIHQHMVTRIKCGGKLVCAQTLTFMRVFGSFWGTCKYFCHVVSPFCGVSKEYWSKMTPSSLTQYC